MSASASRRIAAEASAPTLLEQLLPPEDAAPVAAIVERLGLWQRAASAPARPRALLNMISTVDGRATLDGRSGELSGAADRALFHGLRAAVDAVLVGAGTVRVERYGRMIPDASTRALRSSRGLAAEPLACVVSGRVDVAEHAPLLEEPEAHVVLLTASQASLTSARAQVDYIRAGEGTLDLHAALAELSARFGVQTLLCEGGPHLARELFAAGLLDELLLTVSPQLAGGEPSGGAALRILAGAELKPPVELELLGVLAGGSELFLHYRVSA
jgi:riboflavin-specific deaminase-like protein